ncbi:hypothetical protein B0H14DRAFT_2646635 [Mycena olivaceomarginata]|nr:hypothetical protein B0H14DRAFT_2646635 [Mycena olivaceomarginata]
MGGIAIRLAASASSGNHPATGPDPIESGRATHIPLEYSDDDEMEWNPVHTVPLQRLQISPGRGIIAGGCRCRKANRNPHHRSMLQCAPDQALTPVCSLVEDTAFALLTP